MDNLSVSTVRPSITVPVIALTLYAVASGYLMSLIPLLLPEYQLDTSLAGWLASAFYTGLLLGAIAIEPIVKRIGHRSAFIACLTLYIMTVSAMYGFPSSHIWLGARFVAGTAVAGIFVVVESWLLHGDESSRAKRLGLYMAALYGGSSIGQLGLGLTDVTSRLPFVATGLLLTLAIVVLLFGRSVQPESEHSEALSLRQINRLSHAAIIGCIVSGLLLGAVYGLMPVELLNRGISHDNIGGLMAVIILGGMAVQPLIPMLSKYLGRTLLMALLCLIGVGAIALTSMNDGLYILAISLFVLGMAAFALYPVAINLGCEKLDSQYITSATQVMLISYSIGSVSGPSISGWLMADGQGLFSYLFIILLGTCIYMLLASVKGKPQAIAGE